jgi:hypothetical protein
MMSLPGSQAACPARIRQALVADDPGLGLRIAFFALLAARGDAIDGAGAWP